MKISIISLIYKSTRFADWMWDSIHKYTKEIQSGEAEFFFVANDASDEVKEHLKNKKYKHFINDNKKVTKEDLIKLGYGGPIHIHYVYKGWNRAIKEANSEFVCLLNSDMYASPDWLSNLLKHFEFQDNIIISSQLIERPQLPEDKYGPFMNRNTGGHVYLGNYGTSINTFNEIEFLKRVEYEKNVGSNCVANGIAYMPLLLKKEHAEKVGLYPEGNIPLGEFDDLDNMKYGDEIFIEKLKEIDIRHVTALDSIVYHLKEGEQNEL